MSLTLQRVSVLSLFTLLTLAYKQDDGITIYDSNSGVTLRQEQPSPPPAPTPKPNEYKCKFLTNLNFYDLTPLSKLGTFKLDGVNPGFNLSFSMCNDLEQDQRCKADEPVMAVARKYNSFDDTYECLKLSGTGKAKIVDHFILDKELNNGIKIHLGGSKEPCDDWRDYDLTVDILCNATALTVQNITVTESNTCFKVVSFEHKAGCKIGQLSALWDWAQKHSVMIAIPFIGIGVVMLLYGSRWLKTLYYTTGIIVAVGCIWLIFYTTFMQNNSEDGTGWAIFIFSLLLGVCLGFSFSRYNKLGNFFLGFISGFCIGIMIFIAIVSIATNYWVLWSLTGGIGFVSGVLTFFFSDIMKIHSTAFFGAFFITNGMGIIFGRYQNPFTVIELIRNGEIKSPDRFFYVYLGGCVAAYLYGSLYQNKKLRQSRKIPRSKDNRNGLGKTNSAASSSSIQ